MEINGHKIVTETSEMTRGQMATWLIRLGYGKNAVESILTDADGAIYDYQEIGLHALVMRVGSKTDTRPKYRAAIY